MDKRFFFSYVLFTSSFLSFPLLAECIPSPDCEALGYTKSDTECNGAPFVRCPFDTDKVACLVSVSCAESRDDLLAECPSDWICTTQNFGGNICYKKLRIRTCEEKGQKTCNSICISSDQCCTNADCDRGYNCNTSSHTCEENKACAIGDIYYSDKTCSTDLASGKTPIGVVGYISNGGKSGLIVALEEKKGLPWGCSGTDTAVPNYRSMDAAKTDFNGKSNTEIIVSQCGSGTSAYYCSTYSAGGISGWYLPAYGELFEVLEPNHEIMDAAFQKAGGVIYSTSDWYRSSSEYDSRYGLVVWPEKNYWDFAGGKNYTNRYFTRCVWAFQQ